MRYKHCVNCFPIIFLQASWWDTQHIGYKVDGKLAGPLGSHGCHQLHKVQLASSYYCHPSRTGSSTQYSSTSSFTSSLTGHVAFSKRMHQIEGGDQHTEGLGCDSEILDKLERWTDREPMKLNMDKCQVLHLRWNDSLQQGRLCADGLENSFAEKGLRILGDKLTMNQQYAAVEMRANHTQLH